MVCWIRFHIWWILSRRYKSFVDFDPVHDSIIKQSNTHTHTHSAPSKSTELGIMMLIMMLPTVQIVRHGCAARLDTTFQPTAKISRRVSPPLMMDAPNSSGSARKEYYNGRLGPLSRKNSLKVSTKPQFLKPTNLCLHRAMRSLWLFAHLDVRPSIEVEFKESIEGSSVIDSSL